jgi:hypothetical protein
MKIAQKYSHLNGEEYLIVHHNELYKEIQIVIESIKENELVYKTSKDKSKVGQQMIDQKELNKLFQLRFNEYKWKESKYSYYITLNRELMEQSIILPYDNQKEFLGKHSDIEPLKSYKQTDFVKNKIAVEVQFGKYSFVAFDLFVKHMLFYSGGVINVGVEILPTKKMQKDMDTGVAYFEGEVYNVMRQGRNSPPVPLLILGIEP